MSCASGRGLSSSYSARVRVGVAVSACDDACVTSTVPSILPYLLRVENSIA